MAIFNSYVKLPEGKSHVLLVQSQSQEVLMTNEQHFSAGPQHPHFFWG
jgi:hypothetical protein